MPTLGREFLQGLTNPPLNQGLFNLGAAVGGLPGQYQAKKKKDEYNSLLQQGQAAITKKDAQALTLVSNQLSTLGFPKESAQLSETARKLIEQQKRTTLLTENDLSTVAGQKAMYDFAARQGDITGATAAAAERKSILAEQAEQATLVKRQVSLSNTAQKLGFPDLAQRVGKIKDPDELKEVAKEIRKLEVARLPTSTPAVRKKLAEAAGISPQEFMDMNLAKEPDKVFAEIIAGEKGKLEPFLLDGKVVHARVNDFGVPKVYDDEQGRWVIASDLGLIEAPPQVQKVENIATGMADELSKIGAKNFAEAYEGAKKSAAALSTINRSLPKLDDMFTGAGAGVKLNIVRYAKTLGVPEEYRVEPNTVANTENYIADSGQRVADYITNLGAGTGLSDEDRRYAEKIVGGNIAVDKVALKRLLGTLKKYAEYNIKQYKNTREAIKVELGPNNEGALSFFPDNFYVDEGPVETRNPLDDSYFPTPE